MTTEEINRYIHAEIIHNGECRNRWGAELNGYFNEKCPNCGEDFEKHLSSDTVVPDYCSDKSPRSLLNEVVARVLPDLKCDPFFAGLHKALAPPYGIGSSCSPLEIIKASAEPIARACVEAWKAK